MPYSLFGNPKTAWCDKNFAVIVLPNGQICYNTDHCNVEAIALFTPADYAARKLDTEPWPAGEQEEIVPFDYLLFDFPDGLSDKIYAAERNFVEIAGTVDVVIHHFEGFGNHFLKEKHVYTDTIIQIALQLAYSQTHGCFAPTYETASTRKFYHGRTETVRSCTSEVVEFVNYTIKESMNRKLLREKLLTAYNAHNKYMEEARNGLGIDRYGLQKLQRELFAKGQLISTHGLFDDPSWKTTGGNGSFRLSISFLGYGKEGAFGYVTAMCPDGYGCFYRINPDSLTFTVTCFKRSDTSIPRFTSNIDESLNYLYSLLKE